jgi:predicted small integral membrane protein
MQIMSMRSHALFAALALAASACDSATDSDAGGTPSVRVELHGRSGNLTVTRAPEGQRVAECTVDLTATVQAGKGGPVTWQDATMRWYFGIDRTAPADSSVFSAQEIAGGWGAAQIAPGQTQRANWRFWAGAPYRATLEIRYRKGTNGPVGKAEYTFTCGPDAPAGGAPLPTISGLTVRDGGNPVGREILPGRTLSISYIGNSGVGLWETGVIVSGAFSAHVRIPHSLEGHAGQGVTIPIPSDAVMGEPIRIQSYAADAFLQVGTTIFTDSLRLVKETAPVLVSASLEPLPGSATRLSGTFAEGDTLPLSVRTSAYVPISWLVYTLGAPANVHDSVAVPPGGQYQHTIRIPVRKGWAGTPSVSVYVRGSTLASNVLSSPPEGLRIYPQRVRPVRSAATANPATDMVLDEARGLLYLSFYEKRVDVLSLATMTFGTPIALPAGALAIDLTRKGDTLLVALTNKSLAVVDLAWPGSVAEVPLAPGGSAMWATGVRVAANGKVLVTGNPVGSHAPSLVEMTSSGAGQRVRADVAAAGISGMAIRSPDRSRIFFTGGPPTCALVYTAASDAVGPCVTIENGGTWSSTPSGSRFARGYGVQDAASGPVRVFPFLWYGTYVTGIHPDGADLYIGAYGGLTRARVSDGALLERIPMPAVTNGWILFTGGGRYLIAVDAHVGRAAEPTRVYLVDLQ